MQKKKETLFQLARLELQWRKKIPPKSIELMKMKRLARLQAMVWMRYRILADQFMRAEKASWKPIHRIITHWFPELVLQIKRASIFARWEYRETAVVRLNSKLIGLRSLTTTQHREKDASITSSKLSPDVPTTVSIRDETRTQWLEDDGTKSWELGRERDHHTHAHAAKPSGRQQMVAGERG